MTLLEEMEADAKICNQRAKRRDGYTSWDDLKRDQELSPKAKKVLKALNGEALLSDIARRTKLSKTAVKYQLDSLRSRGLVELSGRIFWKEVAK